MALQVYIVEPGDVTEELTVKLNDITDEINIGDVVLDLVVGGGDML